MPIKKDHINATVFQCRYCNREINRNDLNENLLRCDNCGSEEYQLIELPYEVQNQLNTLNAEYKRTVEQPQNNLMAGEKEIKQYLGTYWPRSFIESYNIFDNIFLHLKVPFLQKNRISILDFGTGTGGNIIGILYALKHRMPYFDQKTITIYSIEGNPSASQYFQNISKTLFPKVNIKIINEQIKNFNLFDNWRNEKFHIISSSKLINEFYNTNAENKNYYYDLLKLAEKLIFVDDGIIYISDITMAINSQFIPKVFNSQVNTFFQDNKETALRVILPLSCAVYMNQCIHPESCFYKKEFLVQYNLANTGTIRDLSKITFKVLVNRQIVDQYFKKNSFTARRIYKLYTDNYSNVHSCLADNTKKISVQNNILDPYCLR